MFWIFFLISNIIIIISTEQFHSNFKGRVSREAPWCETRQGPRVSVGRGEAEPARA